MEPYILEVENLTAAFGSREVLSLTQIGRASCRERV